MAELIIYPNATSVDGYVSHREYPTGATWAEMLAGAGNSADDNGLTMQISFTTDADETDKWQYLGRGIVLFDTSALSGVVVLNATLSLFGVSRTDMNSATPDINIYSSDPASNDALIAADWTTLGSTPLSAPITYASWNTGGYNDFVLNAAGLATLSLGGISKFGIRNANYDVAGTTPPHGGIGQKISLLRCWTADKGGSYRPKLTIVYYKRAYPTDLITRVTNIIHRYVRATQAYTMEVNFGEVTSDFGLPEWAEKAMTAYVPDADKPTTAGDVDKAVYNPLRDYMNRPPPSSVMITRTSLTPPLTEPFTSTGATAAQMAAYAGMSQSDYNKIVRQAQVIKALQEFGPLIGPDDLAKLKAKYPGLGSDTGVPRGGTTQFTRWAVGISPVSIRGAQPAAVSQYEADMRFLAQNAPYLLTPEELQQYG